MSEFLRRTSELLLYTPLRSETASQSLGTTGPSCPQIKGLFNVAFGGCCATGPTRSDDSPTVVFTWNKRDCTGNRLHEAILDEHVSEVERLLDQDESLLGERFTYETRYGNQTQEGSGLAIHLAVSRDSVEIVEMLLERRARLDSMVTRGGKDHYDVLHAAVFSEGRGGHSDVIRCLLDAKAEPTKNLEGHYPLHKAYQCGVLDAIPMLTEDMRERGLLEAAEEDLEGPIATPLQVGISTGKLTGEQLSQVASLTAVSLKVFLRAEPRSIPSFFERMRREEGKAGHLISGYTLAEHVTVKDVCKCLKEHPQAADVLLNALTTAPEVENEGWHGLPTRVSFGPRSTVEKLRALCNPEPLFFATYQPSCRWEFNARDFTAPAWHNTLTGDFGRPVYDVDVQVCYLPELACAEFLGGLLDADHIGIFENRVVQAVLDSIWWGGAYKEDLLQFFVTLCGLILLLAERAAYEVWDITSTEPGEFVTHGAHGAAAEARRLHARGGGGRHARHHINTHHRPARDGIYPMIADDFVGARGLFDFMHSMVQLCGFIAIGRGRDYWTVGNMVDLLRSGVALYFYFYDQHSAAQVVLIIIYWTRLLEVSFSESLMRELLPITQLAKGLAPSSVVCFIAVCAFTHAKWVMQAKPFWPDVFHESFALLLTAALPVGSSPSAVLLFAYLGVSIFSVFFLNIFISVISENYCTEKEIVATTFQAKRCRLCHKFLLRAAVLPNRVMSQRGANATLLFTGCFFLASMSYFAVNREQFRQEALLLVFLTLCLVMFAAYQDPAGAWSQQKREGMPPRYMWIASVTSPEPETAADRMQAAIQDLRSDIQEIQALVAAKREAVQGDGVSAN